MHFHYLLAILLLTSTACGDHCVSGETTCNGDTISGCGGAEAPDEFRSLLAGCGEDRCLDIVDDEGLRQAVCSTTGELDPRCPADGRSRICIDDVTLLRCNDGYGWAEEACLGACITMEADGSNAFCSVDPAPSPACTEDGPACEPESAIQCRDGYVIDRIACAEGPCVASPRKLLFGDRLTYCVTAATCDTENVECTSEDRIEGCVAGQVVWMQCNEGMHCGELTVDPFVPMESWQTEAMCHEH
jgi:hypothetical protein